MNQWCYTLVGSGLRWFVGGFGGWGERMVGAGSLRVGRWMDGQICGRVCVQPFRSTYSGNFPVSPVWSHMWLSGICLLPWVSLSVHMESRHFVQLGWIHQEWAMGNAGALYPENKKRR